LLALVLVAAADSQAASQHNSKYVVCGQKGPFANRTDGLCQDAGMYGPLLEVNGSPERAFQSSLMVNIFEDFLGNFTIPDVDSADGNQFSWGRQDAGSQATCGTKVGDADDGQVELLLDNNNEVGDCTVYWGDEQNIDSDKEPVCIFRLQVEATPAAADKISWGLGSARNALMESMTSFVAFSDTGADLTLDVESDDNSTDVAPVSTGVTLTAATFYEFMISLNAIHGASPTNAKMFYRSTLGGDWTAVATTTTLGLGADTAIQPFVQVEKTSGTTTPGVKVDYIGCYWERS
jgi:hypothetical protein